MNAHRALGIYTVRMKTFKLLEVLFISYKAGEWKAYETKGLAPLGSVMAQSTRAAEATAAFSTRTMMHEICRAATWASLSIFVKHYRINQPTLAEAGFGRRIP